MRIKYTVCLPSGRRILRQLHAKHFAHTDGGDDGDSGGGVADSELFA